MYCTSWASTVCSLYLKGMELEKASWVLFALAQQHDLEERNEKWFWTYYHLLAIECAGTENEK